MVRGASHGPEFRRKHPGTGVLRAYDRDPDRHYPIHGPLSFEEVLQTPEGEEAVN
jgi:hypothetical protein